MKSLKKLKSVLICAVLFSCLPACSNVDQIESPIKNFQTSEGFVAIQGRWKRTDGNFFRPHRINTTSITCDRSTMICREIIAEVLIKKEAAEFKYDNPRLFIDDTTYEIITWSNDVITARYLAPVADFELKISIKDQFAERHWRETKARGVETSDPKNFGQWILE